MAVAIEVAVGLDWWTRRKARCVWARRVRCRAASTVSFSFHFLVGRFVLIPAFCRSRRYSSPRQLVHDQDHAVSVTNRRQSTLETAATIMALLGAIFRPARLRRSCGHASCAHSRPTAAHLPLPPPPAVTPTTPPTSSGTAIRQLRLNDATGRHQLSAHPPSVVTPLKVIRPSLSFTSSDSEISCYKLSLQCVAASAHSLPHNTRSHGRRT